MIRKGSSNGLATFTPWRTPPSPLVTCPELLDEGPEPQATKSSIMTVVSKGNMTGIAVYDPLLGLISCAQFADDAPRGQLAHAQPCPNQLGLGSSKNSLSPTQCYQVLQVIVYSPPSIFWAMGVRSSWGGDPTLGNPVKCEFVSVHGAPNRRMGLVPAN